MKPTWQNTLYPHGYFGHIDIFRNFANELKYDYFCWNDRIYDTVSGDVTNFDIGSL